MPEETAKKWLIKQALWQIFLPAPRYVPGPKFDVSTPNAVHQADLLFLPHNRLPRGRKVYKYALTVVDVASRYKEAEPLTSKDSAEVAKAFQSIYKRSPLTWLHLLQVDPGREFMGSVTKEMENNKTYIRCGRPEIHRDQGRFPFNKNHRFKFSEFLLVEWNASDRFSEFEVTCSTTQGMLGGFCCVSKWRTF